ncbi:MAG: ATP-binding protein [Acidimicrobiales bacterium]
MRVGTESGRRLRADTEAVLYRIVQEAVTNVVRHAHATSINVDLSVGPRTAVVRISDDGTGFDPNARTIRSRHLGLTSMRERAHAGGSLTIESGPGQGTTVRCEVPLG